MSFHYTYLAFALLLLWFPRGWLRHGKRVTAKPARRFNAAKVERDPYERGVKLLAEAMKSRNWVDFLRGAVGAYGVTSVAIMPPSSVEVAHAPTLCAQGGILLVAVLIQMVRLEGRFSLFAPIFFVQGIALGVGGPMIGLFAMIGSWALTPVLPGAGAILFVQGAFALILGMLLKPENQPHLLLIATGVTWLPMLASVLLRKRLSASLDKRLKIVPRDAWAEKEADRAAGEDDVKGESSRGA